MVAYTLHTMCGCKGMFSSYLNTFILFCLINIMLPSFVQGLKRYSEEMNAKQNFRTLEKPFRMAKINTIWSKATLRLSEPKLQSLYNDLKIQDKEELTWKKLKVEGHDESGLREAELRKKLRDIIHLYGLVQHFDDVTDQKVRKSPHHMAMNEEPDDAINKSLFKDKKLNALWQKAEKSGFTDEELKTLKEEFIHHQEKIDQYYDILKMTEEKDNVVGNDVNYLGKVEDEKPSKHTVDKSNLLREKHSELKNGYDRLHRLSVSGPESAEFMEPKVQGLWKIAQETNFKPDELESLRTELKHYEHRLLKLRHLQAEVLMVSEQYPGKIKDPEKQRLFDDKIKKQTRKVQKIHADLESRIISRHGEL